MIIHSALTITIEKHLHHHHHHLQEVQALRNLVLVTVVEVLLNTMQIKVVMIQDMVKNSMATMASLIMEIKKPHGIHLLNQNPVADMTIHPEITAKLVLIVGVSSRKIPPNMARGHLIDSLLVDIEILPKIRMVLAGMHMTKVVVVLHLVLSIRLQVVVPMVVQTRMRHPHTIMAMPM